MSISGSWPFDVQRLDQRQRIALGKAEFRNYRAQDLPDQRSNYSYPQPDASGRAVSSRPAGPDSGAYLTRSETDPLFLVPPECLGGPAPDRKPANSGKQDAKRVL